MTHEFVRDLPFNGVASQKLWKLSEPVTFTAGPDYDVKQETVYVVTSAAVAMFTGAETYIFPANAEGEILNRIELPGSYRGGLDHNRAIENVRRRT